MPRDGYLGTEEGESREIERRAQQEKLGTTEERQDRRHGYRDDQPDADLDGIAHRFPGRPPKRYGVGQPGGEVGGERG
jgi:hypothetical protein